MREHLILYILLCCLPMATRGQTTPEELDLSGLPQPTQAAVLRFWFDDDAGSVQTTTQLSGTQTLDVSELTEGLHTLHYQVADNTGAVSITRSALFLRVKSSSVPQAATLRYWFDEDAASVQTTTQISGTQTLDVSELTEGLHTLHYQVTDNTGTVSITRSALFLRVKSSSAPQAATLRYWFDDDAGSVQTTTQISGTQTLDVSGLTEGLHTLHYQVADNTGTVSITRSALFLRVKSSAIPQAATLRYWFDEDAVSVQTTTQISGTQTLDVSELTEGLHTLHYQVTDNTGTVSITRSALFMKMSYSNNTTAKQLRYWFDNDANALKITTATNNLQTVDVSRLSEGLHTIHYQVVNDNGSLGTPCSSLFLKMDVINRPKASSICYWFDNLHSSSRQAELSEVKIIDAADLSEGSHSLHFQLVADDGQTFPVASNNFERWLYDIYISRLTEYGDSIVSNDPLFAQKPSLKIHYLPDDVSVRGHLTVDEGTTLSLGKFVQTANWGSKNDGSKYTKTGVDYYHPTTLLNIGGIIRADSVLAKQDLYRDRWHFISLPFNANVKDIDVPENTYWALRSYDGEARAMGLMNETWRNLRDGDMMEAGRGYIIQLTKEGEEKTSRLTFKAINDTKKNNIFTTADVTTPLKEHQAEFAHNRSWNLVGNPYPSFFDSRCIDQNGAIIVWNGNGYSAYSLADDNYILMPFEAFFIQKPLNIDALTFSREGRQHTHEVQPRAANSRQASKAKQHRSILNFTITDGADADHSRVVINEQASLSYETEKDAPKFMEPRPQMPQLFSVESGVQYAINERPMGDGLIVFSVYVPADGEYRFSLEGDAENIIVLDAETGALWSLADGDYVFTATKGMHNARFMVSLKGEATAIAQIKAYDDGEIKVAGGQLSFNFMRDKHIKVFSLDGRVLYNDAASHAEVKVSHGVYLIDIDGKTMKIMVK